MDISMDIHIHGKPGNIGVQRFVNTEKFTFEVDDQRKQRRKHADIMVCGDVMSLAYRRHEY